MEQLRTEQNIDHQVEIAVDKEILYEGSWKVWIGESGLIFDATLTEVRFRKPYRNCNNFYRMQLLEDTDCLKYYTYVRWSRFGSKGHQLLLGNGSLQHAKTVFENKFEKRTGLEWTNRSGAPQRDKYRFLGQSYQDPPGRVTKMSVDAPKGNSIMTQTQTPKPIQDLVCFIFNHEFFKDALLVQAYSTMDLPFGKLSKETLTLAYLDISLLADLLRRSDELIRATPEFIDRAHTQVKLKEEITRWESYTDVKIANDVLHNVRTCSEDGDETKELLASLDLKEVTLEDVFRISRNGESERLANISLAGSDRRLLWHGSRSEYFPNILKQGLRIAPSDALHCGHAFGKGVYFADVSTKSANYCEASKSDATALILLCEVELGVRPLKRTCGDRQCHTTAKDAMEAAGRLSVHGVGQWRPGGWVDAEVVHPDLKGVKMPDPSKAIRYLSHDKIRLNYNEYIVYDPAQIRLRYLIRTRYGPE
ncbi:MAG: hypothetical protein Q9179_004451 [Wetmoreana sp. 5 TL-2023]